MAGSGSLDRKSKLTIEVSTRGRKDIDIALRRLGKKADKAVKSAIKKTLRAAPKMVTDLVRKDNDLTAPVKALKAGVKTKPLSTYGGMLTIKASPIPLEKFQHRPRTAKRYKKKRTRRTSPQVTTTVYRGKPHKRRGNVFVARDRYGDPRIYERFGVERWRIKPLFGPSTYTLLQYNKKNSELLRSRLQTRLNKELLSQISRFTAKG